MDRVGHLDVLMQLAIEKSCKSLDILQVEYEYKFNAIMAFNIQNRNANGCARPFMSTCMGSRWMEVESTRPYFKEKTEKTEELCSSVLPNKMFLGRAVQIYCTFQSVQAVYLKILFQVLSGVSIYKWNWTSALNLHYNFLSNNLVGGLKILHTSRPHMEVPFHFQNF